jgi:hypothetical protein
VPAVVLAILVVPIGYVVSCYPPFGHLQFECPRAGRVIDVDTGESIAGALVSVSWRVYDYPMLDGAGSYEISVEATTDSNGRFVLPEPKHRKGFFKNDAFPPYIKAPGYVNFTYSDRPRGGKGLLIYPMKRK